MSLVKIGDELWVDPERVISVHVEPAFTDHQGTVHTPTVWVGIGGGSVRGSKWTLDMVTEALGMVG